MHAISAPAAGTVTCTVDRPARPAPAAAPALGPTPPEVATAREARDATTLSMLARHADPRVRAAVAANPAAPGDALKALADDPEGPVVAAVASNPSLPDAVFADLYENPRPHTKVNVFELLYRNGPRGAYLRGASSLAHPLLNVLAVVFSASNFLIYAVGGKVDRRTLAPGHPVALQTFLAAVAAFWLIRALEPLLRVTAERVRARSVWPRLGMWGVRVTFVLLVAAQVRACAAY
ncbi:MAG: hypothetical protein U0324_32250 [Polyangiales bacterium]